MAAAGRMNRDTGHEQADTARTPAAHEHRQFGRVRSRDEARDPNEVHQLLIRHPRASLNDLSSHERDMRRRTSESDHAERAEHDEKLAQSARTGVGHCLDCASVATRPARGRGPCSAARSPRRLVPECSFARTLCPAAQSSYASSSMLAGSRGGRPRERRRCDRGAHRIAPRRHCLPASCRIRSRPPPWADAGRVGSWREDQRPGSRSGQSGVGGS